MASPVLPFGVATRALEAIGFDRVDLLSDHELLELIGVSAQHERLARAHSAALAGELARRSAPELGHDGLAQRLGHRTPQKLVQATTGSASRDAAQAVRIGGLAQSHPWMASIAPAVADGSLSADAVDAILGGLGAPTDDVPPAVLADAVSELRAEAPGLDADRLFVRARGGAR